MNESKNKGFSYVFIGILMLVLVGCETVNKETYNMINLESKKVMDFSMPKEYFMCDKDGKEYDVETNDDEVYGTSYSKDKELVDVFRYFRKESDSAYVVTIGSSHFMKFKEENAVESFEANDCKYYIYELEDPVAGQKEYVVLMSESDEVYIIFSIDTNIFSNKEYDDWDIKDIKKVIKAMNANYY